MKLITRQSFLVLGIGLVALLLSANPSRAQDSGKSWGQTMIDWAQDQFQDTARTQGINQLLGTTKGEPINTAIDLAQNLNSLVNTHGVGTLNQQLNGNDPHAADRFLNQDVPNDVLNMVLPGPLKDIVPNTQSLYNQAQQWANQLVNGVNQFSDKVSGAIDNLKAYFSGDASNGMQPGSSNAQQAQSGNLGAPTNISSTLSNGAYQTDGAQSPTQRAANQPAPGAQAPTGASASPSNDTGDEDYGPPPVVTTGPNSERDTDYSAATVAPMSMQSNDPNSCIETSNSFGVDSASINCNSDAQNTDHNSPDSNDASDFIRPLGSGYLQSNGFEEEKPAVRGGSPSGNDTLRSATTALDALAALKNGIGAVRGSNQTYGSNGACAALSGELQTLAQQYSRFGSSSICGMHRLALQLNQQTLSIVERYAGQCPQAANALASTQASVNAEAADVRQVCN